MATRTRSSGRVTNADWSGTAAGSGTSKTRAGKAAKRSAGAGLAVIGVLAILIGAWGGIVPYLGPTFGYSSNGIASFHWSLMHALLYLVPGAVAVFAGFCLLTLRGSGALFGLLLAACGAWFILGVVAWPILHEPGVAVFTTPATSPATNNFINLLGYNLGPGIVLALLGGMALTAGRRA
jgi:hypothetical protein